MRIGQWVQLRWGWEHIPPQTWLKRGKTVKNYNYIEKFVIRIHKQGLSRIPIQGVLAESMVVSPKIDFSPSQVGV